MKKITIFITQSCGEVDIVLPIISALKKKNLKFEIFFTSEYLYNLFNKNKFYLYCANQLQIEIKLFKLLNKFDYDYKKLSKIKYRLLRIISAMKSLILLPNLKKSNIFMHEISNQVDSTNILYYSSLVFNKKIYVYHHGQSLNPAPLDSVEWKKYKHAEKKLFLLFHESSSEWAKSSGYTTQHNIGYPASFVEWHNLVHKYNAKTKKKEKHVLILTRGVHPLYMDKDKYIKLVITSYESIRKKFDNIKIIFKVHPRENTDLLLSLIDEHKMINVEIIDEYCGILSINSECVISFWTSAILTSLLLNVPSVEYFIEPNNFRTHTEYHNGSMYTNPIYDILCINQQHELETFLSKVKSGVPFKFNKFENNFKERNLSCFD